MSHDPQKCPVDGRPCLWWQRIPSSLGEGDYLGTLYVQCTKCKTEAYHDCWLGSVNEGEVDA
jgi:hypothetical protein